MESGSEKEREIGSANVSTRKTQIERASEQKATREMEVGIESCWALHSLGSGLYCTVSYDTKTE